MLLLASYALCEKMERKLEDEDLVAEDTLEPTQLILWWALPIVKSDGIGSTSVPVYLWGL